MTIDEYTALCQKYGPQVEYMNPACARHYRYNRILEKERRRSNYQHEIEAERMKLAKRFKSLRKQVFLLRQDSQKNS